MGGSGSRLMSSTVQNNSEQVSILETEIERLRTRYATSRNTKVRRAILLDIAETEKKLANLKTT